MSASKTPTPNKFLGGSGESDFGNFESRALAKKYASWCCVGRSVSMQHARCRRGYLARPPAAPRPGCATSPALSLTALQNWGPFWEDSTHLYVVNHKRSGFVLHRARKQVRAGRGTGWLLGAGRDAAAPASNDFTLVDARGCFPVSRALLGQSAPRPSLLCCCQQPQLTGSLGNLSDGGVLLTA